MFGGAVRDPAFRARNREWSAAVTAAVEVADPEERAGRFAGWRQWPASYESHPRGGAEHFLPLIVCAAAGGDGAGKSYVDEYMGLDIHSYYWD